MSKNTQKSDLFGDVEKTKEEKAQDFASMFEQSLQKSERFLSVGDTLRAEILSIGKEESFVSTGTPVDGIIHNLDLLDENKKLKYQVGEFIEVVVLRTNADEVRVTRKGSRSAPVDLENLEDAFDMEIPVEGKVTEVVNGGYRVSVQGQAAFCPISQLESRPIADPKEVLGKKYQFLITQFDARKKNIVVSRRKLLDLQRAENAGLWMQENKVGDVLTGTVTRTEGFGAFVEMGGGVEGLVHISEIGFTRLKHASEALKPGESVQVKILKVEEDDKRLKVSLSIKQAGGIGDPWMQVPQKFSVGTVCEGTVDKKESFGLFVILAPGITGLLPKSKWRDAEDPKIFDNLKKNDKIKVRIDEVKFEERRISLGVGGELEDDSWKEHQSQQSSKQSFGALAAALSKAQITKKK